jgi:hypothetical protein
MASSANNSPSFVKLHSAEPSAATAAGRLSSSVKLWLLISPPPLLLLLLATANSCRRCGTI